MKSTMTIEQKQKAVKEAIEKILDCGLTVMCCEAKITPFTRKANAEYIRKMPHTHIKIIGGARVVDYYPTTGTAYSNAVKGKFKAARGKGIFQAIQICVDGRI